MRLKYTFFIILAISFLGACSDKNSTMQPSLDITLSKTETNLNSMTKENPFLTISPLPFQFPQFDLIVPGHYLPAFDQGMAEQIAEIEVITRQPEAPTFANTMIPLELSGQLLTKVENIFYAMISAHTNEDLNAIEVEISPLLSAHSDQIYLNEILFSRINMLYQDSASLGLAPESLRLLEETHKAFIRAGAKLNEADKQRLRAINTELAELSTSFGQNVLNEVNSVAIIIDERAELAGLSDAEIQAAADEASARDLPGKYLIPLLNTSVQPSLGNLENRKLRQLIYETSLSRGNRGGEYDTREILSRTAHLRSEKAKLLGFPTHSDYILQNQTAQTVEAVNQRLSELIPPAVANARREAADLQAVIDAESGNFELAAWDWAYYTEKVRQDRYQFDESELRPYFEVNNVIQNGLFYVAEQIYGLSFKERYDLPVYEENVRVFEVFEEDGNTLAFFILDLYARSSKRGGAWMNSYLSQSNLLDQQPIVGNHLNITEPPANEPTLMTFSEVTTMFHEFGHALHGMFSNVNYPTFSGTNVPRDFVEFPSQVNEMWASWPEVLANYAVHYETSEPLPAELLDRVIDSQKFNQGFETTSYLAASYTDLALHQLKEDEIPSADEIMQFEVDTLRNAGFDLPVVPPRYRFSYFSHIMGGYSSGYYSYIWSEVLDADTVEWFKENGGMLRANGQHFRDTLLSRGGSTEAMELFRNFRGREPNVEPLLIRRGLN